MGKWRDGVVEWWSGGVVVLSCRRGFIPRLGGGALGRFIRGYPCNPWFIPPNSLAFRLFSFTLPNLPVTVDFSTRWHVHPGRNSHQRDPISGDASTQWQCLTGDIRSRTGAQFLLRHGAVLISECVCNQTSFASAPPLYDAWRWANPWNACE